MQYKPIRILHMIASLNIGGSQAMVMNLYRAIDRNKVQFDFIIDHPDEIELKSEIESLGGKIFVMPTFKGKNIVEVRRAWNKFFIEHPEYKILHTHSRSYASVYLPIAKKHGLITIAHSHSISNGKGSSAIIKKIMQFPIRWQADYMFACSQEAGEWLFGKKSMFKVIPNAIDSELFIFNPQKRQQMRRELGINDEVVIGHVGRLTEPKNHSFLLEIFSEYTKRNENTRLLIIGDGEKREILNKKAKDLGLEDKVIFLGSRNNTYDYYQAMDCFVFPSLWEGLGIAAIEAQTSGLPCLVSDTVPRRVDIGANLVTFISITDSAKNWAKRIKTNKRVNEYDCVKSSGFDISESAKELQCFYEELAK